ncbi:restriction endonuclease subunit S [Corynebacterium ulceribovis]|uniref:restriction endonuclease subunit S n=1 Tax=Corynebacterium ulceribovis TaxID=487732 RepID=UPI0003A03862|nr:restriction endonuclease subunit S [Corynebacterium ulceribovis]
MNWPTVKLGEVCEVVGGGTPKTGIPEYWDGDIPWLTPRDLSSHRELFISKGSRSISQAGLEKSSAQLLPAGTVLWSSRAPIGHVAIASNEIATNQGFKSFVPGPKVDSQYLAQVLRFMKEPLQELGTGATFKEVSAKRAREISIPLPPLEEQKRIAAILRVMETQILRVEKETELLHQVRFAAFARLSHQTRVSLNDVVEIRSGQVDPKHPKYRNSPHVAPNALMSGETAIGPLNSCAEDRVTSGKYRFEKGDVLYSKIRPYLNKVVVAELDGVCSADMYALVPKAPLTPYFLRELLATPSFLAYADRNSGRSSIPKINRDSLMRYELNIPLENEIEKFSKVAVRIQQQIGILNRKRSALELLRVSLASRLFSKNMG